MKKIITILITLSLIVSACKQSTKNETTKVSESPDIADTVIVKQANTLSESYQVNFYSKSYSYHWIAGNDTLDFYITTTKYKKDSTLYIRVKHTEPILFTTALEKINESLPLIKEDFDISKIESISFKEPIFYLDLATVLSSEYEEKFGRKNVSYEKFSQFLMQSSLNSQLNDFLDPLNKKVKYYGFEKFHLIDKENYKTYLPNTDLTEYPEFTFNAHSGIYVELENK